MMLSHSRLAMRTLQRATAQCLAALLLACPVLVPVVGHAAEPAREFGQDPCALEQTLRWRGGTVRLENDLFAGTDSNYTNGVASIEIQAI